MSSVREESKNRGRKKRYRGTQGNKKMSVKELVNILNKVRTGASGFDRRAGVEQR